MTSNATYQRVPTSSPPRSLQAEQIPSPTDRPLHSSVQAEFNRPPPAWWKRVSLVLALILMAWLTVKLGGMGKGNVEKPQVIYASRYSEEFKYRPAASPVITEHLPDGRIRLRGATPGGVGFRDEDMPKSAAQIKAEKDKMLKDARDAAKKRLGLTGRKGKGRKKADKATRTTGEI